LEAEAEATANAEAEATECRAQVTELFAKLQAGPELPVVTTKISDVDAADRCEVEAVARHYPEDKQDTLTTLGDTTKVKSVTVVEKNQVSAKEQETLDELRALLEEARMAQAAAKARAEEAERLLVQERAKWQEEQLPSQW